MPFFQLFPQHWENTHLQSHHPLFSLCVHRSMLHMCNILIFLCTLLRVCWGESHWLVPLVHTHLYLYMYHKIRWTLLIPPREKSHFNSSYFFWLCFWSSSSLFSNIIQQNALYCFSSLESKRHFWKKPTKTSKIVKIINRSCFHYVGSFHCTCPEHLLSDGAQWTKLVVTWTCHNPLVNWSNLSWWFLQRDVEFLCTFSSVNLFIYFVPL